MKLDKLFIALTVAGLATTLAPVSAHSGGLAFDAAGNLFERGKDSIFKFTPDGKKSTFASGLNSNSGVYNLAFDAAGDLFVADQKHSIFKFTPDGNRSTFANDLSTVGGRGFKTNSMVFDRSGNLFESNDRGQYVIKFSPDGTKSVFASGVRGDLAFDGAGNLFVADHVSRSILKFTPDGTSSSFTVDVSSTSPDKKWEFVGGEEPRILEAGTHQVVLGISEGRGEMVWAPDSKRFGFNYSVYGRRGYTFESVAFYELRGDKWIALHSLADDV